MLKRALYDYVRSFTWKNFIRIYKKSNLFMWIFLLNIFNMCNALDESKGGSISFLLWMFVFLLGIIGMELCPIKLPKIMYLSPMNEAERKQYLVRVYWIRIIIPTFVEAVIETILLILGIVEGYMVFTSVFYTLFAFIFVGLEPRTYGGASWGKDTKTNLFALFGMVITAMTMLCVFILEEELHQGINGVHYALMLLTIVDVIMLIVYLSKLPKRLEKYATYEERFEILKGQNKTKTAV